MRFKEYVYVRFDVPQVELFRIGYHLADVVGIGTLTHLQCQPAIVLQELETVLAHLNDGAFLQESRTRSAVIGREVTVLRGEETFQATAVAIDDDGALVVQTENGTQTLFSGEVSLRL